jgi:hypothetical protein
MSKLVDVSPCTGLLSKERALPDLLADVSLDAAERASVVTAGREEDPWLSGGS